MKAKKLNKINTQWALSVLLLSTGLLGSACGKESPVASVVTNVQLKTTQLDGDDWVQVSASLTTGGFKLAGVNLPVSDPKDQRVYGQITLIPNLCSANCVNGGELALAVNLTKATSVNGVDPLLPNGTALPVGGLQNATVVAIPVQDTGVLIYFAFGPGVAMLGTAVPFKALDPAGQYLPGANIFVPLQFGPVGVNAGMFVGSATNTTGIGLFVDLASVMDQLNNSLNPRSFAAMVNNSDGMGSRSTPVNFRSALKMKKVKPSSRDEQRFYKKMYQLNNQGLKLEVR